MALPIQLGHQQHSGITFVESGDLVIAQVTPETLGLGAAAYLDVGETMSHVKRGDHLDDLHFHFLANATLKTVCRRAQLIHAGTAEIDGSGTVTFTRNGSAITGTVAFARGDVFGVTAQAGQSVTVQRYLPS